MGMRMPETFWAVFKWRVINLRSCCIWLVDSLESIAVLCELNSAVAHVVDGTLVQYSTIFRIPDNGHMGLWRSHLNRKEWQEPGQYQVCKLGLQKTETLQLCHNTVYMCVAESNPPNLQDVFMMYCNMTHGTTFRDLCIRFNPQARRIDERKLVQFGLLHRLIRRVHKVMTLWINSTSNLHINWLNYLMGCKITVCVQLP